MPFDIALPKSSEERGEKGVGRNYPSIARLLGEQTRFWACFPGL